MTGSRQYGRGDTSTVRVGNQAERAAAEFLISEGYTVLELNYRRKYCEIDVVARRGNCVYFVEVKYRATDSYGSGLEYISGRKLLHMRRAAGVWVAEHAWRGEYTLSAIEVGGPAFQVGQFIESIV